MMRGILAVFVAAAGIAIEAYLINRILGHPAAGPEQAPLGTKVTFVGLASLPFLVLVVLMFHRTRSVDVQDHWLRYFAVTTAVGVLATFIGLRQFGHSTLAILLLGYVAQWVTIGFGWFRNRETSK
jgi:drug/metabolite transporter (DMT)-like permease